MSETKKETNQEQNMDSIKEYGQAVLSNPTTDHQIHLLSVIGEIEGHECLPSTTKTTKYEHSWRRCGERPCNCRNGGVGQ